MKTTLLSIVTVLITALPAWADGHFYRGGYPDRGSRYVESRKPSWGISFGYSGGYYGDSVSIGFSYSDGPRYYPRPVVYVPPAYCPPPVVVVSPPPPPVVYYPQPAYCPPPVVVYPTPRPWSTGGYVYSSYGWGIGR